VCYRTVYGWRHLVKATEVIAGLAESNGGLPLGGWLKVTCGLTTCTLASAADPMLGNEYGRTSSFNVFIAENLLKGSIATEADSRLSWSGGGVERVHPTVVRFASDEEDDLADDNDEVTSALTYLYAPYLLASSSLWIVDFYCLLYSYLDGHLHSPHAGQPS